MPHTYHAGQFCGGLGSFELILQAHHPLHKALQLLCSAPLQAAKEVLRPVPAASCGSSMELTAVMTLQHRLRLMILRIRKQFAPYT